ncbi:MAG: hypothetical protein AB2L11_06730 [Syntrophobacteraceae bacterium]
MQNLDPRFIVEYLTLDEDTPAGNFRRVKSDTSGKAGGLQNHGPLKAVGAMTRLNTMVTTTYVTPAGFKPGSSALSSMQSGKTDGFRLKSAAGMTR